MALSFRTLAEDHGRTPAPSCVFPALQLKRECSQWPKFGADGANPRDLSKGIRAVPGRDALVGRSSRRSGGLALVSARAARTLAKQQKQQAKASRQAQRDQPARSRVPPGKI
jgi:hypothetical protein